MLRLKINVFPAEAGIQFFFAFPFLGLFAFGIIPTYNTFVFNEHNWKIAFNICIAIFGVACVIGIIAIASNFSIADEALNDPKYLLFFGVKPFIQFIKAIDVADAYVTVLSAIASCVTYIFKQISKFR